MGCVPPLFKGLLTIMRRKDLDKVNDDPII